MACAGPSTLPATITLQKSAPEAARQLLLGSHVLSRKAIQGYQAMDNLPHPLRCCSKLRSVPCPSLTSKSMLAALFFIIIVYGSGTQSQAGLDGDRNSPSSSPLCGKRGGGSRIRNFCIVHLCSLFRHESHLPKGTIGQEH